VAGDSPESPAHAPAALSTHTSELDVVESGRRGRASSRRTALARPPQVRLGTLLDGGIAPAVAAIVERGVRRRPGLVAGLSAEVELKVHGGYPPVRIVFSGRLVLIEDGPAVAPDLRAEGDLGDLISMMVTPLLGGVPSPINARGRAALGKVMLGRVRVEGRLGLMRRLLAIVRI
jgi:hypothetical protein